MLRTKIKFGVLILVIGFSIASPVWAETDRMEFYRDSNVIKQDGKYYSLIIQDESTYQWNKAVINFMQLHAKSGKTKIIAATPEGSIRYYDDRWSKKTLHEIGERLVFAMAGSKENSLAMVYVLSDGKVTTEKLGKRKDERFQAPDESWEATTRSHRIESTAQTNESVFVLSHRGQSYERQVGGKTKSLSESRWLLHKTDGKTVEEVSLPENMDEYQLGGLKVFGSGVFITQYKLKGKTPNRSREYRTLRYSAECSCMEKTQGPYSKLRRSFASDTVNFNSSVLSIINGDLKKWVGSAWENVDNTHWASATLLGQESFAVAMVGGAHKIYVIDDDYNVRRVGKDSGISVKNIRSSADGVSLGINRDGGSSITSSLITTNGKVWRELSLAGDDEYYNFDVVGHSIVFPNEKIKISDLAIVDFN